MFFNVKLITLIQLWLQHPHRITQNHYQLFSAPVDLPIRCCSHNPENDPAYTPHNARLSLRSLNI